MFSSEDLWKAIDGLALRSGMSVSGLAILAGLDPTTLNKSKRTRADGRPRWASTATIAKILTAVRTSPQDFFDMVCGTAPRPDGRQLGAPLPADRRTAKPHLLLVDPDALFSERMAARLEAAGYDVDRASDLRHALEVIEHGPPLHMLITELHLPYGAYGRNLARIALTYRPGLKIIYVTDLIAGVVVLGSPEIVVETILQKPLEAAHLETVVAGLLEASQVMPVRPLGDATRRLAANPYPHHPPANKPNGKHSGSG